MLVLEGKIVICIEAKFRSGNTLSHQGEVAAGHKPGDRAGLLRRYLDPAPEGTKRAINRERIGEVFHSQLFRNIVFASVMANGADWHVVNLVSKTQWESGKSSRQYSFLSPEEAVHAYLYPEYRKSFTFRTWEGLRKALIDGDASLATLDAYMRSKSAHYQRAFDLD